MKLTKGNLHNHVGERFIFSDLSKALQKECAEQLAEHFDQNGYGWHEYADEEELYLAERLEEHGFCDVKLKSTQSFCVQGDSTCVTFNGIDIDKFWEHYGSRFTGKHDKRLLKSILVPKATCESWQYYSSDFNLYFADYHDFTVFDCEDCYEKRHTKLYDDFYRIAKVFEHICSELDGQAYKDMSDAFDYWYSADHIAEYLSEDEDKVWWDGDDWNCGRVHKTYRW